MAKFSKGESISIIQRLALCDSSWDDVNTMSVLCSQAPAADHKTVPTRELIGVP